MSLIGNEYPIYDWEWRNLFIKLSDLLGESRNPTVGQIRDMKECHDHLTMRCKWKDYPLKHKISKKEYLFHLKCDSLCFKTYEGEPYKDKYGRWWNDKNLKS